MNDLYIVATGLIVALILIYFKQYYTTSKNGKVIQRNSSKAQYQKTSQSQQISTQKYNEKNNDNNKGKYEKQIQNRQSPQKVDNFQQQQNNLLKSPIIQAKDQRQNQVIYNQKDSFGSRVTFKDDKQDYKIQQSKQKTDLKFKRNELQQNIKVEYLQDNFRHSEEKQLEDQQAFFPKQNNTLVQQKIFNLYNISCRGRNSDAKFLGPAIISQNYDDLFIDKKIKQQLNLFLKGYRSVRGDGNCYFTSIAFQYFEILLLKFSNLEFKEFLSQILTMPFQIQYLEYFIENSLQNMCAQRLVQLLQQLRVTPQNLEFMMADPNQEFYGLAIIFFRNLAQLLYVQNNSQIINEYKPDLSNELLTWEFQCNDSEMINSSLAKYLNIQINVYLIDQEKSEVTQLNYSQSSKNQIHLIYIPGHYEIGIPV